MLGSLDNNLHRMTTLSPAQTDVKKPYTNAKHKTKLFFTFASVTPKRQTVFR